MKNTILILLFCVLFGGAMYAYYYRSSAPMHGGYYLLNAYNGSGSTFFLDDKKVGAGSGTCISMQKSSHVLALEKEGKRQEIRIGEKGEISAPSGHDLGFSVFFVEKNPKVEKDFGCK